MPLPGWRVAAIDDSPLECSKEHKRRVRCIAVIARLGCDVPEVGVEGLLSFFVERDGLDATKAIINAIRGSRWSSQLSLILLHTICFAGFNIVDLTTLHRALRIPIAAITRKPPNMRSVKNAMTRLDSAERRMALIKRAGKLHHSPWSYLYYARGDVAPLLKQFFGYPWPLRLAHIVASGVAKGQSSGRP